MKNIEQYYQSRLKQYEILASRASKREHLLGTSKLLTFAAACVFLYLFRSSSIGFILGGCALLAFLYAFFAILQSKKLRNLSFFRATIVQCHNELLGLKLNNSAFDGGNKYADSTHCFTSDLDVFGDKSLFQMLNRTVTPMGTDELANYVKNPLGNKEDIERRQEAVKELSMQPDFRLNFAAWLSMSLEKDGARQVDISQFKTEGDVSFNTLFWRFLCILQPCLWIALGLLAYLGVIPASLLGVFFVLSLLVVYSHTKTINRLYYAFNKTENTLKAYAKAFITLEDAEWNSKLLKHHQQSLCGDGQKASESISQLSKIIGALDQRFSLMGVFFNAFLLWDIKQIGLLQKWTAKNIAAIPHWFKSFSELEALFSLSNFAFNHPDYCYPTLNTHYFSIEGKAVGHPFIAKEQCVCNDISIEQSPYFMIVTGANMAGKSTFLRTIGVNYLLSCLGCPVFAKSFSLFPAPLVTSLNTSDSLNSNESYFFAELKRLQSIIQGQKKQPTFIILDEILKGTNSVDKQKGSLALMKQLIGMGACGILATHDLILGNLEKEFPQHIKNYCFEANISGDTLNFDYTIKQGIAQNMNACFLMDKMGIAVFEKQTI